MRRNKSIVKHCSFHLDSKLCEKLVAFKALNFKYLEIDKVNTLLI